jgi:hypothetical protein
MLLLDRMRFRWNAVGNDRQRPHDSVSLALSAAARDRISRSAANGVVGGRPVPRRRGTRLRLCCLGTMGRIGRWCLWRFRRLQETAALKVGDQ